jgi:RNA-binding protein
VSALGGKQRRFLRAEGHARKVLVQVGKEGVTAALVAALEAALERHELVKVKVLASSPLTRGEAAEELAEKTGSEIAQILGNTILLYRRHPEEPKLLLPGEQVTGTRKQETGDRKRGKKKVAKKKKG